MNKSIIVLLLLSVSCIFFSGCATIFNQNSYLSVATMPSNATVIIRGMDSGEKSSLQSPCTLQLSQKSDYQVQISLAGYQSETIVIRRGIRGWFWGNILLGGVIGMIVDYNTGAMYEHTPINLNIDLTKITSLPETISGDFPVTLIMRDGTKLVKYLPITFHKMI